MSIKTETQDIMNSIQLKKVHMDLFLILVAKHKNKMRNKTISLPLLGEPLGPAAIDKVSKSMIIAGLDHINLGRLPTGYVLCVGTMVSIIPLPESVILASFSEDQLKIYESFKKRYESEDVEFQFIQMNC